MDPRQQQPPRPNQRTPYISDFVASPRPQQAPATSKQQPAGQPPFRPQSSIAPAATGSNVSPIQQTQTQLGATQSQQTTPQATERPPHTSFELPEPPPVSPRTTKVTKPHQGLRDVLSIFSVLASALLLAFCLITFVFQSYQVDGPSMQSTLQNNDHLIVWKVPKTLAKATGRHYIPKRGDVIVFNERTSDSGGGEMQLIKRVIALPGERVTVKNNAVTVYNEDFPNGFSPDKTLPYGSVITSTPGNSDVTLEKDEVYVIGDNRTNSRDSRVFGPIESDQIVGKLILRVLPLNTVTRF